jgi:hypothetical protein
VAHCVHMTDAGKTRQIIESATAEVLGSELEKLRSEIVRRVLLELDRQDGHSVQHAATKRLQDAIIRLEEANSQSDILRALLDGAGIFSLRSAVFLLRAEAALGWEARGFTDNERMKLLTLDLSSGLPQESVRRRSAVSGPATQFDGRFVAEFGMPADGNCVVAPLVVREKVVALLYADAGTQGGAALDPHALQLLTRTAGIWLELIALRKSKGLGQNAASPQSEAPDAALAELVAAQEKALAAQPDAMDPDATQAEAAPAATVVNEELHRKARKFAKLLVEEIKLYNLPKVRDGKLHRNLYDRLKDEIEKSRAAYDQRYAGTAVADAGYFVQELIRGLADGDSSLFGSNFPR